MPTLQAIGGKEGLGLGMRLGVLILSVPSNARGISCEAKIYNLAFNLLVYDQ